MVVSVACAFNVNAPSINAVNSTITLLVADDPMILDVRD